MIYKVSKTNILDRKVRLLLFGCGLIFVLIIDGSDERIVEKSTSICDGPCGQLLLSCPDGQHIAVRDAVHRIQKKTAFCKALKGCSQPNQDICCEQTSQDCVVGYSLSNLKELHRNCSGRTKCVLQTERSDLETAQCSSRNGQLFTSQTNLNYVCVSDNVISEICSPKETVIEGRTLFAMIDSRDSNRPSTGSACMCIAESIKWPTTNTIAVFLIDLRLNVLNSSECSNASLSVRSGSKERNLNCQTIGEPRLKLPFVAVLNNSNVATLKLEINNDLPEFVWMGFEANENEDIRLTCKLEGLLPVNIPSDEVTLQDVENILDYDSQDSENNRKDTTPVPAIIGGIVTAVVVIVVVVAVLAAVVIRKRKKTEARRTLQPDIIEYSTTDENLRNLQNTPQRLQCRKESVSFPEMYVSTEEVIANKRKSNPDPVNINRVSDFTVEEETSYTSALEILKRRHQSQKTQSRSNDDRSNGNLRSVESNYDRLNGHGYNLSDAILESYDQLEPETIIWDSSSFTSGVKVQKSQRKKMAEISKRNVHANQPYDDNAESNGIRTLSAKISGNEFDDYIELERASNRGHSNASYYGIDEMPSFKCKEVTSGSSNLSLNSVRKSYTSSQVDFTKSSSSSFDIGNDEVYNDAESEPANRKEDKADMFRANKNLLSSSTPEPCLKDKAANSGNAGNSTQGSIPVAAPRRKSRTHVTPPQFK